jgi:hypothetical protein
MFAYDNCIYLTIVKKAKKGKPLRKDIPIKKQSHPGFKAFTCGSVTERLVVLITNLNQKYFEL